MKRHLHILVLVLIFSLLAACNLPYAAQPTPAGPAPENSATPFPAAPAEPAAATQPAINVITTTPGEQPSAPPAATLVPSATGAPASTSAPPASVYPDTPEGVIQAFVEAYPDDTSGMLQYLSASLKASLPAGGPGEVLNVQGDINGMLILSGSAIPNPPQAEFQVALQVGTEQVLRTFNLGQENSHWVITGIQ